MQGCVRDGLATEVRSQLRLLCQDVVPLAHHHAPVDVDEAARAPEVQGDPLEPVLQNSNSWLHLGLLAARQLRHVRGLDLRQSRLQARVATDAWKWK